MRKITYIAVCEPDENGCFSVWFPDLPGCTSYGKNIEDAQRMAKEALELHIYGMEKDKEQLPEAHLSGIKTTEGDLVIPITVYPDIVRDEMDNRRVKTNCTIPRWLKLKAEKQGINFSQVLETSLREMLA
jgi:predicted RNase H-like HicB family nuclease